DMDEDDPFGHHQRMIRNFEFSRARTQWSVSLEKLKCCCTPKVTTWFLIKKSISPSKTTKWTFLGELCLGTTAPWDRLTLRISIWGFRTNCSTIRPAKGCWAMVLSISISYMLHLFLG